jgi:hypothetical protein
MDLWVAARIAAPPRRRPKAPDLTGHAVFSGVGYPPSFREAVWTLREDLRSDRESAWFHSIDRETHDEGSRETRDERSGEIERHD